MEPTTVDYVDEDAGIEIHLVVKRADYGRSLLRTVLMEAAPTTGDVGAAAGVALMASKVLYPNMVAAVAEHDCRGLFEVWPPPLDDFMKMPEELGIKWERATFDHNPQWLGRPKDADADGPKKVPGSSEQFSM